MVFGADFFSAVWAVECAVLVGLVYIEFVGLDLLGYSLLQLCFLKSLKPNTILRDFSELYTNIAQIKPNKRFGDLSFWFLFSFKMWTSSLLRVHVSEVSYLAGAVIKILAFAMLVLVKVQFRSAAFKPF